MCLSFVLFKMCILTLLWSCSGTGNKIAEVPEKPNIILILADDIGYGDFKSYNPDSKLSLPHIELLAEKGITFTDAHSPSCVCAPTRYGVMTGNYPFRGNRILGTWGFSQKSQVLLDQQTIGQLMKNAGYNTAMFGKFHLGGEFYSRENPEEFLLGETDFQKLDFTRRFRMGPLDMGFDYSWILPTGIQFQPFAFFENDKLIGDTSELKILTTDVTHGFRPGFGMPYWDPYKVGPIMTRKAIDFMKNHWEEDKNSDRPFFIYYCSQAIHMPICPAESIEGIPVQGVTFDRVGDFIYELDVTLGLFMDELEKAGELDHTLIILTSDNGAWPHRQLFEKGHNPNAPMAGWKGQMWEGGHRVPFIAAWGIQSDEPIIPHGARCNQLIGLQDLYATFAEITGQRMQEGHGLDSHGFLTALTGKEQRNARRYLVIQGRYNTINDFTKVEDLRYETILGENNPVLILRDKQWKLIVGGRKQRDIPTDIDGEILGLYNLETDPLEQHDLKDSPELKTRISEMYDKYNEIVTSPRSTEVY